MRRPIWFRRRSALPAPGILLNLSERGALVQLDRDRLADAPPWPLYLRHGDEIWLSEILRDPLASWVVSVERDLVRLRLINDAGILQDLRAFLSHVARLNTATAGYFHAGSLHSNDESTSVVP
jgi:hypothetical protein